MVAGNRLGQNQSFEISVKREPDGVFSSWLQDEFQPGMELRITGPRGFSVHAGTRRTIPKNEIPERPDRPWRLVW